MPAGSAVNVAVIYYSSTGTVAQLAQLIADAAEHSGAEVRLRRAAELAPQAAIDSNPAWAANAAATADILEAVPEDMLWADAVIFGTPTRFGNVTVPAQAVHRHPGRALAAGQAGRQGLQRLHREPRPGTAARNPPCSRCTRPSTTSAASSSPPATPNPRSSPTAIRTAPPTSAAPTPRSTTTPAPRPESRPERVVKFTRALKSGLSPRRLNGSRGRCRSTKAHRRPTESGRAPVNPFYGEADPVGGMTDAPPRHRLPDGPISRTPPTSSCTTS